MSDQNDTIVLGGTPHQPSQRAEIDPGQAIGRYTVLYRIGAGGMGVVYAAYDPDLDRKVAIKLVSTDDAGGADHEARARLLREAQAMAKLQHPNVISVHDVGILGDAVFIAMDFIEGATIGRYIRSKRPTPRQIIEHYVAAGRGLVAAHAAGLIHRDFKPDNVLVGNDGRVCVLDFGLARLTEPEEEMVVPSGSSLAVLIRESPLPRAARRADSPESLSITRTGALLGTPAYMAPEQHLGLTADARSDQFSFCIALWEGLYGQRPFSGKTHAQVLDAITAGRVSDPPSGSKVDPAVRRVLLRGLALEPRERYERFEDLLDDLLRERKSSRAMFGWAAAAIGVAAAGAIALAWARTGPGPCEGAEARLGGIWDDTVRERAEAAFSGTGKEFAADAWTATRSRLDAWARSFRVAHRDACEATHVRGEQSEALLDLRMRCLGERLDEFAAVTEVLVDADAEVVAKAVDAARRLPPLDMCADAEFLRAAVQPPADPEQRAEVDRQLEKLARAHALGEAGRIEPALELCDEVLEAAKAIGYEPLLARAYLELADVQDEAGKPSLAYDNALQGLLHAEAVGDDRLAAKAWIDLVWYGGYRLARHDQALESGRHAEALLQRIDDRELVPKLESAIGDVMLESGQYQAALENYERALELFTALHGPDDPLVADVRTGVAHALQSSGRHREALREYEAAMAITVAAYGARHPDVATDLTNIGSTHDWLEDYDKAQDYHSRALAILQGAYDPDHPQIGIVLNNLASAELGLHRYDDARRHYEEARRIWEKAFSPDHPDVALTVDNLGLVAAAQGDPAAAERFHREALRLRERALGPDHPDVGTTCNHLGELLAEKGEHDEAGALHRRALQIFERTPGGDPDAIADTRVLLGNVALARKQPEQAREHFEAALALLRDTPDNPIVGEANIGLQRADAR